MEYTKCPKTTSVSKHIEQFQCPYCDTTFCTTILIDEHIKRTCPLVPVDCILKAYGCKTQILRKDLQEHYISAEHQTNLLKTEPLNNCQINRNNQAYLENGNDIISSTNRTTMECDSQSDEINEALNMISRGVEALNHDMQFNQDTSIEELKRINELEKQLETIQESIQESNILLQAKSINLSVSREQQIALKEEIEAYQCSSSYDGILIWKISNVKQKLDDAHSERQISIYSPPFYSSPTGYKMCARLYFLGDGNARRTHISLFFILMRGVNDSLLTFPFTYKVAFCLYDQSGNGKHIVDSFRPDTRSNSFQKPLIEMNIASGIPKFAPISVIQQSNSPYVKNNTMFIKVMVDFTNLPRTILPFVLALNPGLPTTIQQRMIQAEIQKQNEKT